MSDPSTLKLAQDLDAAFAANVRHYGRQRAIAKLEHMLAASAEAQRVMDAAKERQGTPAPRAAE